MGSTMPICGIFFPTGETMQVDLNQLRVFVEVVRQGGFSAAASTIY